MNSDIDTSTVVPKEMPARRRSYIALGFILLLIVLSGLFIYKWGNAYTAVQAVQTTGKLSKFPEVLTTTGAFQATAKYFKIIWPALVFGILIGAMVRTFISPNWILKLFGTKTARQQMVGALAGTPLMLCSCCITPVFAGVYEHGARLGPSLALLLASPGLNLAALVLTFLLFTPQIAVARLVLVILAVFGLTALVGKLYAKEDAERLQARLQKVPYEVQTKEVQSGRGWLLRFLKSLGYITLVTVPFIAAGVAMSSLLLPTLNSMGKLASILTVASVATLSLVIALPTFFEIPLALLLLQMGAPSGAAVTLLFAGPIINLPSLFVLARETSAKISLALAGGLWFLAFAGGMVIELCKIGV